jgi:hypothetical protein
MFITPTRQQILQFLIDEGFSDYKERTEKGEFLVNSPFVRDSKKKLGISYSKGGVWNCFKSGNHGAWWSFVRQIKGFDNNKESQLWFLKNYFSIDQIKLSMLISGKEVEIPDEPEEKDPQFGNHILPLDFNKDKIYISYLRKRYFDDDILKQLKIFVDHKDQRIVFPVYEQHKLIFYAARAINPDNPIRWLNSKGTSSHPIWNLENVREEIWIFEGIFDAVRVWPKGVTIFGLNMHDEQIKKILDKNPYKIVIVLDDDSYGFMAKKRVADRFASLHPNVWVHIMKDNRFKDFGEMDIVHPNLNLIKWDNSGKLLWEVYKKDKGY